MCIIKFQYKIIILINLKLKYETLKCVLEYAYKKQVWWKYAIAETELVRKENTNKLGIILLLSQKSDANIHKITSCHLAEGSL